MFSKMREQMDEAIGEILSHELLSQLLSILQSLSLSLAISHTLAFLIHESFYLPLPHNTQTLLLSKLSKHSPRLTPSFRYYRGHARSHTLTLFLSPSNSLTTTLHTL